jgi:hypothetical protein
VVASVPKKLTLTNETEALIERLTEQKLKEIRQKEKDEEAAKEKAAKNKKEEQPVESLAEGQASSQESSEEYDLFTAPKVPQDDGIPLMVKYINSISQEHQSDEDKQMVRSVFTRFADGSTISKNKAQFAYEQLFEDWDVDLTGQQEQAFERDKFDPVW